MKKSIFTLAILFVISLQIFAQTQTIRGKVLDKDSKQPLPGATIILLESNPIIGVTTDMDGDFSIPNVNIGRQGISISFIGYNPTEVKNLLLQAGKEIVLTIELVEKVENLGEVVVKAYSQKDKAINEMAPVSAQQFSIEQTERFAGSLGDPARMVGNYAGVAMQNDSRNDIIIRGNSPIGVIWRLDDIEIPNPNHFGALGTTGGPVSMLNNNLLTNSDFFTGAFPAEFGNGISGAFDLHMRSGNNEKTEFIGQIGFNGFEFGAEGPFSKTSKASYLVSARYSTLALMHKIGFGTGTGSAIPYYQDLTFKFDLPTKNFGKFSLFGILGDSHIDLGADIKDTRENSYNMQGYHTQYASNQKVAGLSNLYFLNEKTRVKTTISAQLAGDNTIIDYYDFELDTTHQYFRSDNKQGKITLASHLKSKINSKNNFGAGFYVNYNFINFVDSVYLKQFDMYKTLHKTEGNYMLYKAYAQYQHKFSDNASIVCGLNTFANTINSDFAIEPRIGFEWKINNLQTFSLGLGEHSQMQPATVYFLQYNDTVNHKFIETNKEVGLTKAEHAVAGYSLKVSENVRFKIETYYQNLRNVPVSPSFEEFSMLNAGDNFYIPTTDSLVNTGVGKNYGIEFTFEKFLDKGYYVLFTTSLYQSKYKGSDEIWRNTAFNSNYVFNLLSGYELKLNAKTFMTFDIKAVYSGGKRYIPIDLTESIANDEIAYDYTKSYDNKFDDYFRCDLRIGFKKNGKKINQEWAIDLQNLTANKSTFTQGYDSRKKEIYSSYQQGFYPMFLYRIQF